MQSLAFVFVKAAIERGPYCGYQTFSLEKCPSPRGSTMRICYQCGLLLLLLSASPGHAQTATLLGPLPYSSTADSPFPPPGAFSYFHLENFEDGVWNEPGVTTMGGEMVGPCETCDSVDEDDGHIDGNGCGRDWWSPSGPIGLRFVFDSNILGHLPTHVGLVWTDGNNSINFEAFGPDGESLGTIHGSHGIDVWTCAGSAAEDRFYGAVDPAGIGSVFINCGVGVGGGIEIDHLQYGYASTTSVGEPEGDVSQELLKSPSPNPANGGLNIAFEMPSAGYAKVQVFDLSGRLVTTLLDENIATGSRTLHWEARDDRGRHVSSGAYVVRIEALGRIETRSVLIAK
jgi:hypothetical protein